MKKSFEKTFSKDFFFVLYLNNFIKWEGRSDAEIFLKLAVEIFVVLILLV